MKRLKFVLAGLLFATPALAQDAGEGEAGASAEVGAEVQTGTEGTDATATVGADANAAVDPAAVTAVGMWPSSAIDRPFFRGTGKLTVGGDFSLLSLSFPDPTGMTGGFSATVDYITLRGAYGITDQISAGLDYSISLGLADGDAAFDGPLTAWGGYQIKHDSQMSVAATAAFNINVGETEQKSLSAGLGLRYNVGPKIGVFTGQPYGPGAVGGGGLGGGLLGGLGGGGHLNINLGDNGPITFDLPVGAMFQATPQINVFLSTQLASIALSNSPYADDMGEEKSAIIIGADYLPLSVGGLFSVNEMIDVIASLQLPDLKEIGFDIYTFNIGARAHL